MKAVRALRRAGTLGVFSFVFAFVFGFVFVFAFPMPAHAALVVSEIMYNPPGANAGHQWIEVTNTGPDSVDLGAKTVRLFDANGNHLIKAYGSASTVLAPDGVAVIAKDPLTFLSEYANFSGTLLKSSFMLAAASGIVGIVQTDGIVLARASYTSALGADGDGNSLQQLVTNTADGSDWGTDSGDGNDSSGSAASGALASGAFVAAAPTPGVSPATLPAPLAAPVKLSGSSSSTNKGISKRTSTAGGSSSKKSTKKTTYGKGTLAPSAEADASADGATHSGTFGSSLASALPAFAFPAISFPFLTHLTFLAQLQPLFSSVSFVCFLALLAFSTFSLMLIQRTSHL